MQHIRLVTSRNSLSLSRVRSRVALQWMRLASRKDIPRMLSIEPTTAPSTP